MRLENLDTVLNKGNETETNPVDVILPDDIYVDTYANNLSDPFEVFTAQLRTIISEENPIELENFSFDELPNFLYKNVNKETIEEIRVNFKRSYKDALNYMQ